MRLLPALLVAFVLFLASAILLLGAIGQFTESRLAVARELTAQSEALDLKLTIREAESRQRGFLLTGETRLLDSYRARIAEFPGKLALLDDLVSRADQQARLESVAALARKKIDEMDETIKSYQSGAGSEAFALVRSGKGEELMSAIDDTLNELLDVLSQGLQVRQQEAATNLWRMWAFVIIAGVATLTLGVLMAVLARMQFVSLKRSEAALQRLNRELEARVVERTHELEIARDRAETLLRDVNHRVGNNLALVSSFLGLQMRTLTDEKSRRALESARARVHTIATTQRKLRLGAGGQGDMTRIDGLLRDVVDDIVASVPNADRIKVETEIEPLAVPSDDAVSVGVIASELLMNALKYAFPEDAQGRVLIKLRKVDEGAELRVEDDGVGKAEPVDGEQGGLGSQIIYLLSKHFGGEPSYGIGSAEGSRPGVTVVIPLPGLRTELQT